MFLFAFAFARQRVSSRQKQSAKASFSLDIANLASFKQQEIVGSTTTQGAIGQLLDATPTLNSTTHARCTTLILVLSLRRTVVDQVTHYFPGINITKRSYYILGGAAAVPAVHTQSGNKAWASKVLKSVECFFLVCLSCGAIESLQRLTLTTTRPPLRTFTTRLRPDSFCRVLFMDPVMPST